MTALASSASAVCSTCTQEGDWSQSASSFLEGTPVSDVPQEYGPKAVRQTASQFENKSKAAQEAPVSDTNASATAAANASAPKVAIKDSTGKDVGIVNLVKSAGNEYSGSWNAQVPAGVYNVNILASSLQVSGTFNDALQISVVASGDVVPSTPAVKNLV